MRRISYGLTGVVALAAALFVENPRSLHASSSLCTMRPGTTLALVRVERDTTLAFAPTEIRPMSMSGVRAGPGDSLLATPGTPMPAARVRLLQLDSTTRGILASQGITEREPLAFIRAAPYRADCRTISWTDTVPFVERGETGYVRATLAPHEQWIHGAPVLIIRDAWSYPYPRRRGLAFGVPANVPLAPAEAMFSLNATLEMPQVAGENAWVAAEHEGRVRALAWARANAAVAELEPIRTQVRRAVLAPDSRALMRIRSRLRGTYRVDMEATGRRATWFFRTHDRPGYGWRVPDSVMTTADLIASPHGAGYQLVGYAAAALDSLPDRVPTGAGSVWPPLVWLGTVDRPTAPGNDERRSLRSELQFRMAAAPEHLWDDLEALVPPMTASDSVMFVRLNRPRPRSDKQPRIPMTVRIDDRGAVRADTSLIVRGRALRVRIERVDTLSLRRPY